MESNAQQVPEPTWFERHCVVGADYPARYRAAVLHGQILRRAFVLRLVPLYLAIIFAVSLLQVSVVGVQVGLPRGLLIGVVIVLALFGVTVFSATVRSERRIAHTFPPGSQFGVAFREHTFLMADNGGISELKYSLFTSVRMVGDMAVLRRERAGVSTYLPGELFTPESLSWFSAKIESASRPA